MTIFKNKNIAFKLSALVLTCATAIFLIIFGYNYLFSRELVIHCAEDTARNLTDSSVNKIETVLTSLMDSCQNLVFLLENSPQSEESIGRILELVVKNNKDIYGSAVSFEPYAFDESRKYFAPYVYVQDGKLRKQYLGSSSYDYFLMDWYQIPKEMQKPIWSEPYFDEGGGNIVMATYSVPFYKYEGGSKRFMGVAGVDVSLSWLKKMVSDIHMYKTGYGFLLSRNGTVVTHPREELIMNESIFSMAEAQGKPKMRELGRTMIQGGKGFIRTESPMVGKDGWLSYAPLPSSGWSLGVFIPADELTADLYALNRIVAILGVSGFIVLLLVIIFISESITKPLRILSLKTRDIADGNLDANLPAVKYNDEVGRLTSDFTAMRAALKEYIGQLTEATAAKERIESELRIARDIQMGTLPKIFPPFPNDQAINIYAIIEPAREVGGDFYDFFNVDDDHLCFVIGDVSGKGVPASLFMAITKTLIKVTAAPDLPPSEILRRVNNLLAADNEASMFVTVFLGIIDKKTGEIDYANGGHNLPCVAPRKGELRFLKKTKGTVVGAMEDLEFEAGSLKLDPGDYLYLYTDGVTEAENSSEQFFSDQRLLDDLHEFQQSSPKETALGIMKKIKSFTQDAPQSDDITMMILQYNQD